MAGSNPTKGPGGELFAFALFAISLILLTQIGRQTNPPGSGNLVAQPRFWPAVGLVLMVLFGAAHLFQSWRQRVPGSLREMFVWLRSLEYAVWFMIYVAAVPLLGYLLSTILFSLLLALRAGYSGKKMLLSAGLFGFAVVLAFKTGLAVKVPGGVIYSFLPRTLQNFMIVNF